MKTIKVILSVLAFTLALTGCKKQPAPAEAEPMPAETEETSEMKDGDETVDYLAVVNKLNPLPENWESIVKTVTVTNQLGREVEVEQTAYEAYLKLKEDLEEEGIYIDLDSVRRSVAEQQRIMDDFTKEYGADYAQKYVAVPGYSEHHTGLALDVYLIIDGKTVIENEEMMAHPEIWEVVHEKMPEYGFILRYLPGKEHITGYGYEPWHMRYVGPDIAKEITEKGITLEGYLGMANETVPEIDYGNSSVYTKEDMDPVITQIKCKFAEWNGCELKRIRYAGDECITEENLEWLRSIGDKSYVKVIEFLMDFHTAKDMQGAWESDHDYTDYQWWLAATEDGSWDIVTWGY
ncbi:MAG: M15 family metallopeptidase [Solobacterium sp.]|nr:M15 family metallopeptidase [Solobacterium sp.]